MNVESPGATFVEGVIENTIKDVTRDRNKEKILPKNIIENTIKDVTRDRNKEKIPPKNIIEMLTNLTRREEVMPLLERVLDAISKIDGLDDAISNLLKQKQNTELAQALQELQNKLHSIYKTTYGGKRRRTNKRKNYKKRRSTKHR